MGRRATDSSEQYREQQAMNALRNRKYDEELQAWLRQIRDEAYVEIKLWTIRSTHQRAHRWAFFSLSVK